MARASIPTLLSLDQWADVIGVSRWEINQLGQNFPLNQTMLGSATQQSPHVWFQNNWQIDFMSREELAGNISRAEEMIAEELRYWPGGKYIVSEELQYPRNYRRSVYGYGGTNRMDWKACQLRWTKIILPGIRLFTLIGSAFNVTTSDTDGDTVLDTFTGSFATTITNPTQISVAFAAADRYGSVPIDDTWLIRPVRVSIANGTCTITGHAAQLAKPILQNGAAVDSGGLDVTVAGNYVTTLEAYWDRCDGTVVAGAGNTANQGQAEWEGDITVPPGSVQTLPIALNARNADMGLVAPDWLLNQGQVPPQPREPDRVVVNYLSGIPFIAGGSMDRTMADIVAHLATGMFAVQRMGQMRVSQIINYWAMPPSQGDQRRPITVKEIDNCPFGTSRGAMWAWLRVQNLRQIVPAITD
jgi:hypothetical protein